MKFTAWVTGAIGVVCYVASMVCLFIPGVNAVAGLSLIGVYAIGGGCALFTALKADELDKKVDDVGKKIKELKRTEGKVDKLIEEIEETDKELAKIMETFKERKRLGKKNDIDNREIQRV